MRRFWLCTLICLFGALSACGNTSESVELENNLTRPSDKEEYVEENKEMTAVEILDNVYRRMSESDGFNYALNYYSTEDTATKVSSVTLNVDNETGEYYFAKFIDGAYDDEYYAVLKDGELHTYVSSKLYSIEGDPEIYQFVSKGYRNLELHAMTDCEYAMELKSELYDLNGVICYELETNEDIAKAASTFIKYYVSVDNCELVRAMYYQGYTGETYDIYGIADFTYNKPDIKVPDELVENATERDDGLLTEFSTHFPLKERERMFEAPQLTLDDKVLVLGEPMSNIGLKYNNWSFSVDVVSNDGKSSIEYNDGDLIEPNHVVFGSWKNEELHYEIGVYLYNDTETAIEVQDCKVGLISFLPGVPFYDDIMGQLSVRDLRGYFGDNYTLKYMYGYLSVLCWDIGGITIYAFCGDYALSSIMAIHPVMLDFVNASYSITDIPANE